MDNNCVCCGQPVPEGRQVCPNCEEKITKSVTTAAVLKPCPFCGKEPECAEEWVASGLHEGGHAWVVRCNYQEGGCGAKSGHRIFKEEAIDAWNKRAESDFGF